MGVTAECWPLAADAAGIWLLSGDDAWRTDRIDADSEPHFEVEALLWARACPEAALLHSTSWRVDGQRCVLSYVAVIDLPDLVLQHWPTARPVSPELLPAVGSPVLLPAAEAPVPRYVDVLHHGIRHLAFLRQTDAPARAVLGGSWPAHLDALRPALAGMYGYRSHYLSRPTG
jgi:hypothetical protein